MNRDCAICICEIYPVVASANVYDSSGTWDVPDNYDKNACVSNRSTSVLFYGLILYGVKWRHWTFYTNDSP